MALGIKNCGGWIGNIEYDRGKKTKRGSFTRLGGEQGRGSWKGEGTGEGGGGGIVDNSENTSIE